MAYRKHRKRILAGSLNLLPPTDKTPDGESIRLQNWRVDQAGQLRVRRGMVADSAVLGAEIHSLFRIGNDRFGGVGATLRQGATLASSIASGFDGQSISMAAYQGFLWAMNRGKQGKVKDASFKNWVPTAPSSAPVAAAGAVNEKIVLQFEPSELYDTTYFTGSVGTPNPEIEETLTEQGRISVESGSAAVVGAGTNWSDAWDESGNQLQITYEVEGWPYTSYVVWDSMVDATHLTMETAHTGATATGLPYRIFRSAYAGHWSSDHKVGSQAYHITCTPAGRWRLSRDIGSADLRFDGVDRDDDKLRFWFYCNNQPAIQGMSVTLFDTAGRAVAAEIAPSKVSPASGSWTQIEVSRRLDPYAILGASSEYRDVTAKMFEAQESGDNVAFETLNQTRLQLAQTILAESPYFKGVGVSVGASFSFDWSAVTTVWFEVVTAEAVTIGYDQCSMVGGVDASLDGELSFYVTFDTADGHESNPSPASNTVVLNKQPVSLSGIPTSPDSQVTVRHIYGIGGRLDRPLWFYTLNDNLTSSANITVTLDEVQARNREMPTDADAPPAAAGMLGPYTGKLIAWSSAAHVNRFWWTPTAQPWKWPGSDDDAVGNWNDVGDESEAIVAVTDHARMLVIHKERSTWRLVGSPDDNDPEKCADDIGLVGRRAICSAGSADYKVGPEGVYRFNGDYHQKISLKVDPIFKGDYVDLGGGVSVPPMNQDYRHTCALEHVNGRLYLSYPDATSPTPNTILVYEISADRWSTMTSSAGGFTALYYEGSKWAFLGGAGGVLYQLERGSTDAGSAIPVVFQSEYMDMGLPDNPKVMCDLVVVHRTAESGEAPSTLTVKMLYDNGVTQETLGSITSTARTSSRFRLGSGDDGVTAMNVSLLIEGDCTSTVTIFEAYLHYYVEARYAKSFDTGVLDFGGVSEVQEVELDATAPGTLALSLHTDLPGNAIAERETKVWQGGSGRRTLACQFSSQPLGRRGRLFVGSDEDFQIHAFKVRVLPVGVYVDGTIGEVWQPEAIA